MLEVDGLIVVTNVLATSVDLLRLVVLALDDHGSSVDVVLLGTAFLAIVLILLLILLKLERLQAHVQDEVLVGSQELFDHFLRHGQLVRILLVLILQVLDQNGFLVVVEVIDVNQLVFVVLTLTFAEVLLVIIGLLVILIKLLELLLHLGVEVLLFTNIVLDFLATPEDLLLGVGALAIVLLVLELLLLVHLLLKLAYAVIVQSHLARVLDQLRVKLVSILVLVHLLLELHHVLSVIFLEVVLVFVLLGLVLGV